MDARRFFLIFGAAAISAVPPLWAGNLVWSTTLIDTSARLDQEIVESVFRFKNIGKEPVTILSVSTSCGCTSASPSQKSYGPGEEGEIKTVFTVGGRSGLQEKTIVVESSDAPDTPTTLVLKVAIPEAFTLEPRLLLWVSGSQAPATEKSSTLTASAEQVLQVREIISDDPAFKGRLVTEEAGKRFRIAITPASLEKPAKGLIRVRLEGPPGTERTAVIYTMIR